VSVTELRWRAVPREDLAWRSWNGDFVFRNQCTGSTHLLGPLAGEVLLLLSARDHPATIDDLAAALTASAGVPAVDCAGAIEEMLPEFERLGLALPDER